MSHTTRRVPADPVITTLMTSRVVAVDPGMALIDTLAGTPPGWSSG
jgi:hypothetical protein